MQMYRRMRPRRGPAVPSDGLNSSVRPVDGLDRARRLRYEVATALDLSPVRIPRGLRGRIREFRPEVVHSLLGSVRTMRLARGLARTFDLPLVPHFMDDWPVTLYTHAQLWGLAERPTVRLIREIIEEAPLLLTIGTDMAAEYGSRYGKECVVVGNSVDPGDFDLPGPIRPERTMCYVGGLHLGRARVLAELARSIESNPVFSSWRIDIFCSPSDATGARRLADSSRVIRYRGGVPPTQVPEVVCRAGALLFVESDDPDLLRFTRLSVSTKVPQYLAARRPVLAIGPESQASIRLLTRSPSTVFASAPTGSVISTALERLDRLLPGSRPDSVAPIDPELAVTTSRARLASALRSAIERRG
jgi:hypothetical protein